MLLTLCLVSLSLATWRIGSLFANENGPKNLFWKIRDYYGVTYYKEERADGSVKIYPRAEGFMGQLISCIWCNTFWIGLIATVLFALSPEIALIASLPFALNAASIIINSRVSYNA
jgi:hypothetical protein